MSHKFHDSILRAYDIRGIIGETLNKEDAYFLGRSFAKFLAQNNKNKIAIGYDGRVSSGDLREYLINGLTDSGCQVFEIGLGPTPMLYFAVQFLDLDAGIMITGSHNPKNHNGFKITLKEEPFFGQQIIELGKIAQKGDFIDGIGDVKKVNIMNDYINKLTDDCTIIRGSELLDEIDGFLPEEEQLKIAWDAGNGAAGEVMKKLAAKLKTRDFLLLKNL